MARFVSFSPFNTTGTPGAQGLTLDALMKRQADLAKNATQLPEAQDMRSPWQGAAYLGNVLSDKVSEGRAANDITATRDALSKVTAGINYDTGATSEQIAQVQQYDPEQAQLLLQQRQANLNREDQQTFTAGQNDLTRQAEAGKPLSDSGRLAADLAAGRITQQEYDAATKGSAKLSDIGSLRDDYVKSATTYDQAAPSFQSMKQAADTALNPNLDIKGKGAADYNMIVAYAKLLDPGSVVREGEVKSASMTGGAVDQVNGWLNLVKGQGSLSDDVRRGIMTEANSRMGAYYSQVKGKRDWLSGVATRHNMNPDDIAPPLAEFQPWSQQPPTDQNATTLPTGLDEDDIAETMRLHPGSTREQVIDAYQKSAAARGAG
ncbi:MAG TPA: hypothetical protein VK597_12460 [Inquilinus sp.]|nr:hypothetical protein [Inquilinus sp.]